MTESVHTALMHQGRDNIIYIEYSNTNQVEQVPFPPKYLNLGVTKTWYFNNKIIDHWTVGGIRVYE